MMLMHALVAVCLLGQTASGNIQISQIAGEGDPGPYRHPASMTELDNGDFLMAYYGGGGEYEGDTACYGKRLKKGETEWSKAFVLADTPWLADGNIVVWQAPDGMVWMFYVNRYGDTWSDSIIKGKVSKDGAQTWSDSFILTWERGTMVRGKPIVLNNGDYLLPVYRETGHDREVVGADTMSFFLRYTPKNNDNKWVESTRIRSRLGNLQPSPVQLDDNHLIAYARRGGGYENVTDGYIVASESSDGGKTWSEGVDTAFPNPNAAVDLLKLKNGNILLVYNDSMNERTPLTVAISKDGGKTWPVKQNIMTGDRDYAYPYAIQSKDGKVHIVFTADARTNVFQAIFDESAITGK
jgi:predicted neuraminidase